MATSSKSRCWSNSYKYNLCHKRRNDNNTGLKLGDAKATIKSAVGIASTGDIVKVSAGSYLEDNPISLQPQVSIVGDGLKKYR